MHKSAAKHIEIGVKQTWSIKNYRYVCNVSILHMCGLETSISHRILKAWYTKPPCLEEEEPQRPLQPFLSIIHSGQWSEVIPMSTDSVHKAKGIPMSAKQIPSPATIESERLGCLSK
jgi:hypothetical protein